MAGIPKKASGPFISNCGPFRPGLPREVQSRKGILGVEHLSASPGWPAAPQPSPVCLLCLFAAINALPSRTPNRPPGNPPPPPSAFPSPPPARRLPDSDFRLLLSVHWPPMTVYCLLPTAPRPLQPLALSLHPFPNASPNPPAPAPSPPRASSRHDAPPWNCAPAPAAQTAPDIGILPALR